MKNSKIKNFWVDWFHALIQSFLGTEWCYLTLRILYYCLAFILIFLTPLKFYVLYNMWLCHLVNMMGINISSSQGLFSRNENGLYQSGTHWIQTANEMPYSLFLLENSSLKCVSTQNLEIVQYHFSLTSVRQSF